MKSLRSLARFSRAHRWWAALAGSGVALLLVLALGEWAGWPFLRQPLQHQLQQRLGAPVELQAPFRLQLFWKPGVAIEGVRLSAPEGLGVSHLLSAQQVDLRWRWSDLLAHKDGTPWPLRAIRAKELDLNLVRLDDGRSSWPVAAAAPMQPGPRALQLPVRVEQVRIGQGQLLVRDASTQVDVRVQLRTGAAQANAEGGRSGSTHQLDDAMTAVVEGLWQQRPVRLVGSAGASQELLEASGGSIPVSLHGRIGATEFSFRGVAADVLSGRALQGSLLVRGPSLSAVGDALGVTLPTTPPFRVATALSHDGGLWAVRTSHAQIGRSQLQADLRYDTRPDTPLLSGNLGGSLLRLKDLGPTIGAPTPADIPVLTTVIDQADALVDAGLRAAGLQSAPSDVSPKAPPPPPANRVLPVREFDLPSLRVMDADVAVAIDTLDLGNDAAIEPLRNLKTQLSLKSGVLALTALQAQAAGGRVSGMTQLDAADPGRSARWQVDLALADLKIDRWLRALQRDGQPLLAGLLAGRIQVTGEGASTAALFSTMNGRASARITKGRVSHLAIEAAGLDLAQALGVLVRGDDALTLNCLLVQTQIQRGVVTVRHALADTSDSSVTVSGQIDLGNESLALRAVTKPKDFSPFSLRTPLLVGGTLAQPELGLESRRLAPRLAAALALAAVAGPAGLLPFLEFGNEATEAVSPCGAAPRSTPSVK